MTADVVNLRRARKMRDRAAREQVAAANRIAHGRTRTERDIRTLENARAERSLDGHRLTQDRDGEDV